MSRPKISLNKLAEYLDAHSSRRKKIVQDAKDPKGFIITRYSDARTGIIDYINSGCDVQKMEDAIAALRAKEPESEFQEQDIALSIELLEAFLDADLPDLGDIQLTKYEGANPKMEIGGVRISVNPDIIITGNHRGKDICGAIKLHISKTNQHTDESAKNVATVLKKFIEDYEAPEGVEVPHKFCIAIDTFRQSYEIAPKSFRRRLARIEDACQEITLWWDKV